MEVEPRFQLCDSVNAILVPISFVRNSQVLSDMYSDIGSPDDIITIESRVKSREFLFLIELDSCLARSVAEAFEFLNGQVADRDQIEFWCLCINAASFFHHKKAHAILCSKIARMFDDLNEEEVRNLIGAPDDITPYLKKDLQKLLSDEEYWMSSNKKRSRIERDACLEQEKPDLFKTYLQGTIHRLALQNKVSHPLFDTLLPNSFLEVLYNLKSPEFFFSACAQLADYFCIEENSLVRKASKRSFYILIYRENYYAGEIDIQGIVEKYTRLNRDATNEERLEEVEKIFHLGFLDEKKCMLLNTFGYSIVYDLLVQRDSNIKKTVLDLFKKCFTIEVEKTVKQLALLIENKAPRDEFESIFQRLYTGLKWGKQIFFFLEKVYEVDGKKIDLFEIGKEIINPSMYMFSV